MLKNILKNLGLSRATKRKASKSSGLGAYRRLRHETLEDRRMLATLTVNVLNDNVDIGGGPIDDDGFLTLRDAIAYVNRDFNPGLLDIESDGIVHIDLTEGWGTNDKIVFDDSLFDTQGKGKIELLHDESNQSALIIGRSVVIEAGVGKELEVSPQVGLNRRAFEIVRNSALSVDVTMRNLAITGADVTFTGGGIHTSENLTLDHVRVADNSAEGNGGGIYASNGGLGNRLTILNSTFDHNESTLISGNDNWGGAIYAQFKEIEITGSTFTFNTARSGGAIYASINAEVDDDPWSITNSVFEDNEATDGGALWLTYGIDTTGTISDSRFERNKASDEFQNNGSGGAIFVTNVLSQFPSDAGDLLIDNVVVTDNEAVSQGGGIHASFFGDDPAIGLLVIQDSVISHNTTDNGIYVGSRGGGLFVSLSNHRMLIDRSSIHNNTSQRIMQGIPGPSALSDGGGLYVHTSNAGAGPLLLEIANTTISENDANSAGGIFIGNPSEVAIRHSTITNNHAGVLLGTEGVTLGGGILVAQDANNFPLSLLLDHTIVMGNTHDVNVPLGLGTQVFKDAVNAATFSPNIAVEAALSSYGGYVVDNSLGTIEVPNNVPLVTINSSSSYIEDAGVRRTFTDGLINVAGTSASPGSLGSAFATHNGFGEAYNPGGAFVDAGAYTDLNLPTYNPFGTLTPGETEIAFDQRDNPYQRVADGDGDSEAKIDIGAIESQVIDTPHIADVTFQHVVNGLVEDELSMDGDNRDGSGAQIVNTGIVGINQIKIDFDAPINSPQESDLSLVALRLETWTGDAVDPISVTIAPDNMSATWTLGGDLGSNQFVLVLRDSVTSLNGNMALDGEWVNPFSTSVLQGGSDTFGPGGGAGSGGDGIAGGDFRFIFTFLAADFNTDNVVDLLDLDILGTNFGDSGVTFDQGDSNNDDIVDLLDLDSLGTLFGADWQDLLTLALAAADFDDDLDIDQDDQDMFDVDFGNNVGWTDLNGDGLWNMDDQDLFAVFKGLV